MICSVGLTRRQRPATSQDGLRSTRLARNDPRLIPVSPLGQYLREKKREISWTFLNRGDRI